MKECSISLQKDIQCPLSLAKRDDGGSASSRRSLGLSSAADRRGSRASTKQSPGLPASPQRGPRCGWSWPDDVEPDPGRVRGELRQPVAERLPPRTLWGAVRREPLRGDRGVDGSPGGGVLGQRTPILPLPHLCNGADVRALHAGGLAQLCAAWLRSRQVHQQKRHIDHLQLQPPREHRRPAALLTALIFDFPTSPGITK